MVGGAGGETGATGWAPQALNTNASAAPTIALLLRIIKTTPSSSSSIAECKRIEPQSTQRLQSRKTNLGVLCDLCGSTHLLAAINTLKPGMVSMACDRSIPGCSAKRNAARLYQDMTRFVWNRARQLASQRAEALGCQYEARSRRLTGLRTCMSGLGAS